MKFSLTDVYTHEELNSLDDNYNRAIKLEQENNKLKDRLHTINEELKTGVDRFYIYNYNLRLLNELNKEND